MLAFMEGYLWGVRVWIWLYLLLSIVLFVGVAIYFFREWIRKRYYQVRFPEKLILIKVFHAGNMYKEYWRLVPDQGGFKIDGKSYPFDKNKAVKLGEFVAKKKDIKDKGKGEEQYQIEVEGKKYDLTMSKVFKWRWNPYPEAHYFYNVAAQIEYNSKDSKISFTAKELNDFEENNLFAKLITIAGDRPILILILMFIIGNALGTAFLILKYMEVI